MKNNNFNNRYSIEYLHPGDKKVSDTVPKKKSKLIPLFFFGLIGYSSFYVWDKGYVKPFLDRYNSEKNIASIDDKKVIEPEVAVEPAIIIEKIRATEASTVVEHPAVIDKPAVATKNEKPVVAEKAVETPPIKKKITVKQVEKSEEDKLLEANNKILLDKLNKLSNQLSIQKKKNNELTERLNKNKELNTNISKLYEDAISSANTDDKDFINMLEGDHKKEVEESNKNNEKVEQQTISNDTANKVTAKEVASNESLNNTVILSTASQVDKILLAMQSAKKQATNKPKNPNNSLKNNSQSVAQMTIDLQQQINKLVSPETSIPQTTFIKALKTESVVRRNAVRSIIIRKGETLWSIAKRAYGNGYDYPKILKANPELKKGKVVRLRIGQVIRVPI